MPEETFDELAFLRSEVRRLRKSLDLHTPGLETLLKRRGFRTFKKEPSDDLFVPAKKFIDGYYGMLQKYSFRLFLRDVIKHQDFFSREDVTRYATAKVTGEYLDYVERIGLVREQGDGYAVSGGRIKSFGETLEWFIAELFGREFETEAIWGVKFKGREIGGDYDVIAKFDGSLIYVEVKSSPPRQIYDSEVSAFLDRVADLSPEVPVFFMDTELRMKDKIVPMFEAELTRRIGRGPGIVRIEKELFEISGGIYIINAKDSILRNIEAVLGRYFRR